MILVWGNAIFNRQPVTVVAPIGIVWPSGVAEGEGGVTQAGVVTASTTGETALTQFGVVPLTATGDTRVTQVGIVLIWRAVPIVCVGEIIGTRTDGLPYTPDEPAPCAGAGVRTTPRTGA